jgi:hypothetical protein
MKMACNSCAPPRGRNWLRLLWTTVELNAPIPAFFFELVSSSYFIVIARLITCSWLSYPILCKSNSQVLYIENRCRRTTRSRNNGNKKSILTDASPEVVFRAITDPNELTNLFPDQAILFSCYCCCHYILYLINIE